MTAARRAAHPRAEPKIARVPVGKLRANPNNIRTDLGDLRELTESIRYEGVLVPLMAEDHGPYLQLLHGHRRWAAAQLAGLVRVPVVVVDIHDPHDAILLMLAEDKKEAIDDADKRRAIRTLREDHGMTWQAIADRLGVSLGTVKAWAGRTPATSPGQGRHRHDRPPNTRPQTLSPTAVHRLLERFDDGELVPTDIVEHLRDWLGDWQPAAPKPKPPPSREADWAAVEALIAGRLSAAQVRPADTHAAIHELVEHGHSSAHIADRIGMSQRNVDRHRAGRLGAVS